MTIEQVTCGEMVMEGISIEGPTTTDVVTIFTALYDLAGAGGIVAPSVPKAVQEQARGIVLCHDVNADPDVLPPSAALFPPDPE